MLHTNTVSPQLITIATKLSGESQLGAFRLVGGTAIALQLGHRKSVDLDFFSNETIPKRSTTRIMQQLFPSCEFYVTQDSIRSEVDGVRVELYDNWGTPFLEKPITEQEIRLATLKYLAAFKLDAIIECREKKDYIDLHVLFEQLGAENVLGSFKRYNPNLSTKSILFALGEVNIAKENKSVMPEMLKDISWESVELSMISAARQYLKQAGLK